MLNVRMYKTRSDGLSVSHLTHSFLLLAGSAPPLHYPSISVACGAPLVFFLLFVSPVKLISARHTHTHPLFHAQSCTLEHALHLVPVSRDLATRRFCRSVKRASGNDF